MSKVQKFSCISAAIVVITASAIPTFAGIASAGQATVRSIQLSNAAPGNAGGTNVMYKVSLTLTSLTTIGGVVIDFCSNSPIVGDSCTAPTGLDVNEGTLTINNQTNITGLSVDPATTTNKLILAKTAGAPSGTAASFELGNGSTTGLTNPNALTTTVGGTGGTFYAKIYTYTTTAGAQGHTTNTPAGYSDYAGVAMSTSRQLALTAKVQETLSFCVYTGADCTSAVAAVNLGDANGVLSTAGNYVDVNTKYDISTNAGGSSPSATVRFKAPLPTSGSNTIATIGTTATAPAASNTSLFGLCTYRSAGSLLTAVAPYNHASCSATTQSSGTGSTGGVNSAQFAFDTTAAATLYGDDLATMTAGALNTGRIAFVGQTSASQAAGIYASTFNIIATPVY